MKKNLTMQLMPLWLLAFFFFASVPIKAQVKGYAGVTKLIGCGSGTNANKAEVSITNVTGGTPPYQYQFNGGAWQPSNVGWLPAGTRNVRIKDSSNNYSSYISVTVPTASIVPIITKEIFYDCDGRPTLKVGVQNPQPSYRYLFKLDNAPTFSEKYLFQNVSTGTHTITVKYEDTTVPSPMMLLEETFGSGPKTSLPAGVTDLHYGGITVLEGDYEINNTAYINTISVVNLTCPGTGVWVPVPDHTSNGTDLQGRFFVTNAKTLTPDGDLIYKKKVKDISPNSEIRYEFYVLNLFQEDKKIQGGTGRDAIKPKFKVRLVDNLGNVISPEISTGEVPNSLCGAGMNNWHKYQGSLNSGSHTEFTIEFRSDGSSAHGWGNDYAIDDIKVWQMPETCGQEVSTTVSVTTLQMPTISANLSNCSPSNNTLNLVVTPTSSLFTYQYQMDGGALQNSNVFTGLAMGSTHTFKVHYKPVASVVTIVHEDFGVGANPTANSYVNPEYYFESMNGATTIYNGKGDAKDNSAHIDRTVDGEYAISVNIPPTLAFLWHTPTDASGTTNGRKLIIDLSTPNPAFYMRPISVLPNKRVDFSAAIFNLLKTTAPPPCNGTGTQIRVRFYPNKAAFLANLAPIKSQSISLPLSATPNDWKYLTVSLSAAEVGANTSLYFVLDLSALGGCNDIAVDDIVVTQQLAECTKDFTTTINTSVTSAFAGVTKLIGCGASANANKAEVTIANVEGGSGTYEYSFDGITWTASNTSWLPVGTHTVSVRDAATHGCPFDMSVTVPAALAQPTIKTEVFYACDGKAILNIGVDNPDPELSYMYSLDGGAYTTTYVYTNVASGTHSVSVQYEYANAPSPVMLLKETFGSGPDKCLDAGVTSLTCDVFRPGRANVPNQGAYGIISGNSNFLWQGGSPLNCNSIWVPVKDHTSAGTDPQGLFFMADAKTISPNGDLFYKKKVKNVSPNSEIKYEFYILNLFNKDKELHASLGHASKPNIKVQLVANNGTVIASSEIGEVDNSDCNGGLSNWKLKEGTLNSGNNTEFTIEFRSNGSTASGGWGDDFCIDDIMVYQIPKACGQIVSATKTITPTGQDIPAFTVSKTYDCATGKGALTVTPTATTGFTYTYTLGSTTYTGTTATFTGLDLEQTYTVSISYQAVSNTITLLNEDFGTGTVTTSPYVPSKYYFQTLDGSPIKNRDGQTRAGSTTTPRDQDYRVAKELGVTQPFWHTTVKDHTGNTDGRMLFIWPQDAVGEIVYQREISVLPNNDIDYSLWAKYYVVGAGPTGGNPTVQAALYKSLADVAANANAIPVNGAAPVTHTIPGNNVWTQLSYKVKAADVGNVTKLYLVVRDNTVNPSGGNDLALDDIVVTQKLPVCTTSVTATLTKGDVATPTLTVPANLTVVCSAPTASATISSWIASATATSTCGTATVTHNYSYPPNLCNVGGAVTVTFSTTDPFGNVVTATRVISFATMTLTITPTTLSVPNGALGGTTSSVVPNITLGGVASPSTNSVTITFSGLPTGVTSTTGGRLIVAPNTPAGTHTITYRVCETAGHNNCKTVNTQLVIGTGSLTVTPVTPLTVPNGPNGGTTSSVLTGVRLNGNVVTNTNSVTISFSGLPAGVTTDTQGRIVIPAGTPATNTLVTYRVCEKLNPTNNCQIVTSTLVIGTGSLTVTPVTPLTVPNGISGGTTSSVLTGVRLNGNVVTNTNSVTISFSGLPAGVTTDTQGRIVIPAGTPATSTLVTYKVCEKLNPTNCQTVTSTLVIGTGSLTVTPVTPLTVPNGISGGTTSSVLTGVRLNGNVVTNTNSVTISFSGLPTGVTTDTQGRIVIPAGTPATSTLVTYKVCEKLNPANCQTVTSTLVIGTGSLTVTPVTPLTVPNGANGGTTSSVLTGVRLNGNVVTNTNSVTITFSGLPAGVTTDTQGRIVIPAGTPATNTLVTYKVCEKLNPTNNCQIVTSTLVIGTGSLTVTPVTPLTVSNGANGGTTSSVLTGVRLNGNVVTNTNSVTITFSGLPAGVTTDTQGRIVIPAGTPATNTLVTYSVCEKLNPTNNCQIVTSTLVIGTGSLTVTPVTPLTVPNGANGGTTSSVLTGVRLNGNVVTNTNSVTITFSGLPAGVTTDTQGRIVIPAGTPATNTLVTYKVCEKLNPTNNCQIVTSTLVIGTGSLTVTPVTPLTVPNGANGGTTSSVLTGVRLNGNVVTNTNSVTITFSGLPAGVTTNTQGRIVIPAGTPATNTLVTYSVCEKLNPTNCHTVTSTLVIGTGSLTVTSTTLTHPNGTQGGTTTGTVLTGVKINGNPVNTASVTITWNTLPPNATGNASGTVTIAPNTPAGTYTISYTVCERLNGNSNCQSVTSQITIGGGSLTATPTNLTHPNGTQGGTTTGTVLTGVKINGNPVNTASVTITWNSLPPNATGNASGTVTIAPNTPAGTYTISYTVCERLNGNSNCQSVTSKITIGGGNMTVTPTTLTHPNGTQGGTTTGTVLTGVKINGNPVNTASVTITWNSLPPNATGNASGTVTIAPNTPAGTYTISYTVCERLNGNSNCQSVTSQITVGGGNMTVTPTNLTHPNGTQGGTTTGTVLTGVKINGNPVNTASVTITWNSLPPNATGNASGTVTIAPNTPAGTYTISYTICERLNGNSNCQSVTSQITIGGGSLTATPTNLTHPNGTQGGTTTGTVLTGVKINGNPVNTASVTITWNSLPPNATGNASGTVTIAPNTPAGTYTISYTVCESLNGNSNCQSVTSQITVGGGSLTATPTTLTHPNGTQGGTTTGTVLTGVKINGNPVNTASVTITWNSLPPNATGNASGTVTIAPNTPAGTYTISYTVCERLNGNSNCQSVTSQITVGGGNMTVTPTNLTHPNGTQGGTTTGTVLTGVKINGNPVNTASVTITWNSLPPNATGNASGTVTIAPNTPAGTYTISYTICERLNGNSNCQSVTSQITIGGGSLTATPTNLTHPNGTQGGTTTGTVLTGVKINGNPVNTASVTITWNSLPPNATGNASGTVTIAPNTPAGTYTISYTVCESLNGNSNCQSVTSQITIGGGNMTVTPTQLIVANGATGGTSVNNVLTGVTINGNPVNTNSVTITWNSLPPGFTGTNSGTVTVPANTPAGTYTVSYTVCERLNQNNNCKTVTSTIIVGNGNMIVVPTPITVPNGTIGGTSTPSVLTGVVLNGNSNPGPNTVSITWNTLPPRATGNNDGTVNVAPNTPAGTYTVSYTICEALNSSHCTTINTTITIGGGALTVTPVTTLTVANGAQGGTTTSSVLTGVSLNGQPANSQSVTITFTGLPAGVTSNTNGQLVVAPGTPATNTTIYYTVCETLNANNNCHTYSTTLVIGTPNLSVTPRTYAIPDATVGGTTSSVLETVTIDGHTPSSQSVTITFGNLPVGIQTTTSGGFRVPAGTPTGIHTVTYTVCEVLNPDHCVTSIATIAVGNVPVVTPNAFTYTGTATVTTPSILDDDTVGTQSATTGTGGNVVINITSTPTGTVVPSLDANDGRVTIPAGTPPGIYTITYDVCTTATPTACTPGAVVITIPNVPVITPDDMVYTDTTTTTAGNILTNDRVGTQSATAGNGGNVSITVTIPATPKALGATVPTLNPNTGVVTVPAGTPSGTYTITYKICTTATPTSCDTGVVTITVSGTVTEAPDTNDVTAYTRINTPVTVGVTSSTTVMVSIPSQPANGTAVSNGDGTITYTPNNGFKGTDSFEYSLCNAAGCRTATISVRVTSELIIYNGVSIGGSDKNNHFHIEGIENYPNNTVRIYNRWGVKVFEMSGYNNTTKAFRGVSDARATLEASDNLPQGTYYYIIEYVDEHNKTQTETGWLYLKKN